MMRIAVHLHIFYDNQVDYFLKKLKNLSNNNFDLFVTMPCPKTDVIGKIKNFKSTVQIWTVENRGYDVAPFIDFLNKINLDDYDYILKLHTKGTSWLRNTKLNNKYISNRDWAKLMIEALLKDKKIVQNNIRLFKNNPNISMIGSKACLTADKHYYQTLITDINQVLSVLNLPKVACCSFIAGTMFMARSAVFKPLQHKYQPTDFAPTNGNVKDGTLAHVFERVFGILATQNGHIIQGIGNETWIYWKSLFNTVFRFFYQNKKTDKKHIIKVLKICVYKKNGK